MATPQPFQDSEPQPTIQPSNGHAGNGGVPIDPVTHTMVSPLPDDDPFSATNTVAAGQEVPTDSSDFEIDISGAPSDEDFVYVSSDPRHHVLAHLLTVTREEGFGKSHFFLTTPVATWAKQQPSLKKFVKLVNIYLFKVNEGGYGLWFIRESLDNWSVSDKQVLGQAKKIFTRRYTDKKVRKGHSSDAIPVADVQFPDLPMTGRDGLLSMAFGEAFVIADTDHNVIKRLLGK
jgi:hypothetical protein